MKNILKQGILIVLLLFSACEKDKSLNTILEGTWEQRFLKGKPNNTIYKFTDNRFEQTTGMNPSVVGTFKISKITEKDRTSGVVYPYTITFTIDGSKIGTYLNVSDSTMVMTSGQAGVDETHFIYDKVK